jgi:hypothetical protein
VIRGGPAERRLGHRLDNRIVEICSHVAQGDELGWDLTRLADTTIAVGTQKTEGLAAFHRKRQLRW